MTQAQINRAVANATGEDCEEIARRGFSLVDEDEEFFPDEDDDQRMFMDWDQHDQEQRVALFRDRQHADAA